MEPTEAVVRRPAMRRQVMRLWARAQRGKADPFTSAVLTVPVFLLYHLGILAIDQRNGVDWVSGLMLALPPGSNALGRNGGFFCDNPPRHLPDLNARGSAPLDPPLRRGLPIVACHEDGARPLPVGTGGR